MSEAQKPVEEPVVAPGASAAPVESTPAVEESKPAETAAPVTEETPATVESAKEEAAPVKLEVKPIEEGILGYKGPGLLKGLIFQKKFFWFGSEPVEHKSLASYLRGEKQEVANHNAAWASHTGKGLLFFSKKPAEKATPSHVFNLSEISDVTEEGNVDFFFTQGGHKYTFQASTLAERDNWVSTIKTKATEAKELGETVKDTEEYKKTHSTLTKPIVAATPAATPKKSTEVKDKVEAAKDKVETAKEEKKEEKAEKAEAKEEKKEEKKEVKEEKKEEKKARKSRSASRKRNSIFGGIGFGSKKEEKTETKEETPIVPATEEIPAPVEPVTAPVEVTPAAPATETTPAPLEPAAAEPRPTAGKRNSIFDSFKNSFAHKDKKPEAEAAPAVPAKDAAEPVSETAPVIPAVESTEPLATSVASPATVPTETSTAPATNGESKVETPAVKSDRRKSSLPWLSSSKKEKATTSDEEGEKKPTSPFAKLRATVKGKTSPKAEKATEKTPEPIAEPAKKEEETPAVTEPIKTEPSPVAASTPQVAATA